MSRPKLLYFVTEDWYFCSHRLELARAAQAIGYQVTVITRVNRHGHLITEAGLELIPFSLSRRSLNPFRELGVLWRLVKIYRQIEPDLVHHVALKPVVYGTIAARLAGVNRVVNAVAGLGFVFSSEQLKARLLQRVLRPLLGLLMAGRKSQVIVQNPTDQALLCRLGIVNPRQVTLIRGSGVDTDRFAPCPEPAGKPIVMLASRLLWPKGVGVFVEAARQLLRTGIEARFVIVGEGDEENPSSIPRGQLEAWNAEPGIEWWGRQIDMPAIYGQAQIVCLPSYYGEGVPKALIEAASCGRPIVTTDAPGCRDIVEEGINGYLVPVRDSAAVAEAIQRLLGDPDLRLRMGRAGRNRVQKIFSIDRVIAETLAVYRARHGR